MQTTCHKKIDSYFQQELAAPPPPYMSELNDECLPRYLESSPSSMEISSIMSRFAVRLDNQRAQHNFYNSDTKHSPSPNTADQTGQILDRMEEYRHTDQEWRSHNQTRLNQVIQSMYHMHHSSPKTSTLGLSCVAKSKYQKMAHSIAKERAHIMQQIKKMRTSKSTERFSDEFEFFLSSVHDTASRSQMSNQRATMIPTI